MSPTRRSIYLLPIGLEDTSVLDPVSDAVRQVFGLPVGILPSEPAPSYAFNESRGQYHSTAILKEISLDIPRDAMRLLAVTSVDLFVPQLNFVFGEAAIDGRVCIISLYRLLPEYYGEAPNPSLFTERAVKEAIHELGHTFGLRHSDNPFCVMHFSNTIWDTDRKSAEFCGYEEEILRTKLGVLKRAA